MKEKIQGLLLLMKLKKYLKEYHREGEFQIRELRPGMYRFLNAGVHMDLIIGTEKALLIDTGNGYADIHRAVRRITDLPLIVVNSHGHLDHACGNYFFDQEIYIHPDDMELCRKHNAREMRIYSASQAEGMRKNKSLDIPKDFDADRFISQGCGKLVPVEEGHTFELGGRSLQVVSLPGHSKGSIGLLCPEERVLYTGDAINGSVYLFLEGSTSLSVYRETVKKAMKLDFDNMIISHGFSMYPKSALDNYLKIAENPDFEHGKPFSSPLVAEGEDVRTCVLPGTKASNPLEAGYASIVISKSLLTK